jgi:serine/threonine protein phosphatase PrpC
MESILDNVQYILTDEEQLTCGFFWFKEDLSAVEYVVAGMYAPMLLDGEKIVLAKANNIPFMNFAFDVSITTIELNDFKRFLIFTDGLVEDTKDLDVDLERLIIEDDYIQDVFKKLNEMELEDDTTIIRISTK